MFKFFSRSVSLRETRAGRWGHERGRIMGPLLPNTVMKMRRAATMFLNWFQSHQEQQVVFLQTRPIITRPNEPGPEDRDCRRYACWYWWCVWQSHHLSGHCPWRGSKLSSPLRSIPTQVLHISKISVVSSTAWTYHQSSRASIHADVKIVMQDPGSEDLTDDWNYQWHMTLFIIVRPIFKIRIHAKIHLHILTYIFMLPITLYIG